MAGPLFAYYVTDHGFGHATRASAVMRELEARGARVLVRTGVPSWLFADEGLAARVEPSVSDAGLAMKDALTVDVGASLSAYMSHLSRWDELLRVETRVLRAAGARAVVSDAGALPVHAARRLGLKAAVVSNFTWDWVVEPYAQEDRRWETVRSRLAAAYSQADLFLHLPLGGEAPAVARREPVPLVVRRPGLGSREVRDRLGIAPDERRPVVAFSFGGVGWGPAASAPGEDLSGFLFLAYGPRPPGVEAEWKELPRRTPLRHCDILASADAVLTKPGYGTFSEALAARTPALVVPRADFRECGPLLESFRRLGRARLLPREDFEAGRWGAGLRALLGASDPWADVDCAGAAAAARRLLELAA
ncbi:MAG: hypothetical protein KGL53_05440 [Elusimicrobia bacterium]|nr:hypothetical protein [Elusimicrobiota bacterium]